MVDRRSSWLPRESLANRPRDTGPLLVITLSGASLAELAKKAS